MKRTIPTIDETLFASQKAPTMVYIQFILICLLHLSQFYRKDIAFTSKDPDKNCAFWTASNEA